MTTRLKIFVGILFALLLTAGATWAWAHGGDPDLIHSCVRNSTGSVRIVDPNSTCLPNEYALDWSIQGPPGSGGNLPPFTCDNGDFTVDMIGDRYVGKDFTQAIFLSCTFVGVNFSDTNFRGAFLRGAFDESNFTNADFTGAELSAPFPNSNFTNADLTNARVTETDLTGADMTGAIVTGVVWSNTVCPDGTNSDDNGGTCDGHLVP